MKAVGLILPEDYKLLSVAAILDVFEAANGIALEKMGKLLFEVSLISCLIKDKGHISDFHGYTVQTVESETVFDLILIPSFTSTDMKSTLSKNLKFLPWLNQQYTSGAEVASFCTGAFLFAASGLLNGNSATTHVDACQAFSKLFPSVKIQADQTVTIDDRLYTSGGSTFTFHLLILLLQKYAGIETATRIAKIFSVDLDRYNQSYFSTFRPNYAHTDILVKSIQEKIEQKYQEIKNLEDLLKEVPASRRNLVRRFKQVTGIPPIEYLQKIRIENAKRKLEHTNLSISEIIGHSGYSDPKSFRKVFQKLVGMTPMAYREKFRLR